MAPVATWRRAAAGVALLLALAACQKSVGQMEEMSGAMSAAAPAAADGGGNPLQSMLAYEHSVDIQLPAERISTRLQDVRQLCETAKFGACVVLNVQDSGGDRPSASISMRMVPAAIEPTIAAAGNDGTLGSRRSHAEDLAVVVGDNRMLQARLQKEHARLSEFQQRRDLAVADMIALSRQIAETEAQLEGAQREAAQHQRRIATQLLTISLSPPGGEAGRSEIGQAFSDFGEVLSLSTAWLIRAVAVLLPISIALWLLLSLVRWLRRRRLAKAARQG